MGFGHGGVVCGHLGIGCSTRGKDAILSGLALKLATIPLGLSLNLGVAILEHCRFPYLLHRPCWRWQAVPEKAFVLRNDVCHPAQHEFFQRVVTGITVEVTAIPILILRQFPRFDHHVAIIWPDQHVQVEVRSELKVIRRQEALRPANGMSAFTVVFRGIHGSVVREQNVVDRGEIGGVILQDMHSIPDHLEALAAMLGADPLHHQPMVLDQRTTHGNTCGRARCLEALRVAEARVDLQLRGLDEVILSGIGLSDCRPIDSVPCQDVWVAEDRALAPWPGVDRLSNEVATRLALTGVNVLLPEAHTCERHATGLVREQDPLAILRCRTSRSTLLDRHVIQ
mmetsp:Transcript_115829/g.291397  ORF Transcript_115829/g.291397 Transcript_115829/m.291397 type:complete len:340 (-) Transcript_115829:288-1307(-)